MTAVENETHFLVWPKTNEEFERAVKLLQPQAEEMWTRIHAAVTDAASQMCRVFTVTGLASESGTSTTAAALAHYAHHELGLRVLLVEADLRHPRYQAMGLSPRCPGFAGVLKQQSNIRNVVFELPALGIHLLPAGKAVPSPSTHVNVTELLGFLGEVEPHFDVVIFDAPPVSSAPETRYLVSVADATIPVIRAGNTLPQQAAYWLAKIGEYRGQIGAVCLAGVEAVLPARLRAML